MLHAQPKIHKKRLLSPVASSSKAPFALSRFQNGPLRQVICRSGIWPFPSQNGMAEDLTLLEGGRGMDTRVCVLRSVGADAAKGWSRMLRILLCPLPLRTASVGMLLGREPKGRPSYGTHVCAPKAGRSGCRK